MNKVIINRILLMLVIFIWGVVLYKYTAKVEKKNTPTIKKTSKDKLVISDRNIKSLELFFTEDDPFIGNRKLTHKVNDKVKKVLIKKEKKNTPMKWPVVKYLGLMKKENGDELALLKIAGDFVKLKKGILDANHKFYVHEIYRDSVLLKMNNEKKIIKK